VKPLGILGGTFDPVHYGHLRPAQEVLRALDLAEIRFIPAANPPHRRPPVATAEQRWRMVTLAVAGVPGFVVDKREIIRGGLSYTAETLESLRQEWASRSLCLMMGMDAFAGMGSWHQAERLPTLANIIVMTRPGWDFFGNEELPSWAQDRIESDREKLIRSINGKIFFQAVTPQPISATQVREAIARGEPVENFIPPTVLEYIRANRIYRLKELDGKRL